MKVKLNPCVTHGFHATLKGGVLNRVGVMRNNFKKPEDNGDNYHYQGKKTSNDNK